MAGVGRLESGGGGKVGSGGGGNVESGGGGSVVLAGGGGNALSVGVDGPMLEFGHSPATLASEGKTKPFGKAGGCVEGKRGRTNTSSPIVGNSSSMLSGKGGGELCGRGGVPSMVHFLRSRRYSWDTNVTRGVVCGYVCTSVKACMCVLAGVSNFEKGADICMCSVRSANVYGLRSGEFLPENSAFTLITAVHGAFC